MVVSGSQSHPQMVSLNTSLRLFCLRCDALRYDVPLVADIHFSPKVAMLVAEAFEKVRVNPGNFVDGAKKFTVIDYDDPRQFEAERQHIEEVFTPLVQKCKSLGRAMRIGTNHGSLSARILSFYGDTPR